MMVHPSCQKRKLCSSFPLLAANQPICNPKTFITLLANNTAPVFLFGDYVHDMPLQAVTCHFFVEAFIVVSHVISHCICSMYHVLTCSGTYVMFICTSCHPPSDTGGTNAYTLAFELFLLHNKFNHCTLANKCQKQPHFLQHVAQTLIKSHMNQTCIHTISLLILQATFTCKWH